MKKKVIIIVILLLIFLLAIFMGFYLYNDNNVLKDKKNIRSNQGLSLMFETDVASGEYKLTNQSKWPGDDYIFNDVLSSCENGSKLTWNEEKKTISKKGSLPDRCMIYFDKYVLPTVTSYEITNTEDSISIILATAPGTSEIEGYYYSIDDGETYVDNTSTTYTFSDLQKGIYKVKIYIKDTLGRKSTILEKQVYVLAKPTSPTLAFDSSYNVSISGSASENGAVEYYYSLDNTNFTKGNTVSVSESSTVYAYSLDEMNQKSDVVSKNVTISQATNVTTTTSYYCNGSYQSSSTCSSSYSATSSTSYSCSTGTSGGDGYCYTYSSGGGYSSYSECSTSCSGYCVSSSSYYKCYRKVKSGTATKTTSYSCPSGGTLSGTTCYNSYTGTLKYRCLNTYYDDNASATAACVNYCASGTYYNGKCYKLS